MLKLLRLRVLVVLAVSLVIGSGTFWVSSRSSIAAEKEITIGALLFPTGPGASSGLPMAQGFWDFFRDLGEKGGINGIKVNFKWLDWRWEVPLGMTSYEKLVADPKVLCILGGASVLNVAIAKRPDEDRMPYLAPWQPAPSVWPTMKYRFFTDLTYADIARATVKWTVEKHWKGSGPPKVGVIYHDNAFGYSFLDPIVAYANEGGGYKVVATRALPPTAVDCSSQVLAMKAADADYVYLGILTGPSISVTKEMKKQGLKAVACGPPHALTPELPVATEGAAEGCIIATTDSLWTEDIPGTQYWRTKAHEYSPRQPADWPWMLGGYFLGPKAGIVTVEAVKRAIAKVGYENLTRDVIRDSIESIRNLSTGNISPPIGFTKEDHRGHNAVKIISIRSGKWTVLSDWFEAPPVPAWEKLGKSKPSN